GFAGSGPGRRAGRQGCDLGSRWWKAADDGRAGCSVSVRPLRYSLAGRDLARSLGGMLLGRRPGSRVIERLERQPRPASGPEPSGGGAGGRKRTLRGEVLQSVTVLGALLLVVAGCSRDSGGGEAQEEQKTVKVGVIAPL